ncbi:MAG: endo-1,4-beta-xylanase [Porticoccaceae bacterium]|jgi:endo-1,4-beta-xylanase
MLKDHYRLLTRVFGIYFLVLTLPLLSAHAFAMAPLNTPSQISGSIVDTTASLSWERNNPVNEVTGYNVYQNNSYVDTVLSTQWQGIVEPDTLYGFSVVAFGGDPTRYSIASDSLSLPENLVPTDLTIPPSTPTNLVGTIDDVTVSLIWDASTDDEVVLGYNLYENHKYLTTVLEPGYSGVVIPTQSYQWYVVAFDIRTNFSTRSEILRLPDTGPVDTTIAPSTPTNLTGSVSDNSVTLAWQASTDDQEVAGYNVYVDGAYAATVFDTQYSGTVPDDEFHNYKVAAFDFDNNFTPLSSLIILPELPSSFDPLEPPTAPGVLTGTLSTQAGDSQTAQVELSWTASTDNLAVAGYNLYRNNNYETTVFGTGWSGDVSTNDVHSFFVVAFDASPNFSARSNRINLPDNGNQAPVFIGFTDQSIVAGEKWSLIIKPVDNDGGVPGLFGGTLPVGMNSVDNFNGTRTLSWQPLQPALGDHTITMTAFDSTDTTLTTTKTITLSVVLPEDLSTIPNPAPTIDAVDNFIVRAGDDVVVRVKAVDANGTVPLLSINNPPNGSTFDVHPREERARFLRFTTTSSDIGTLELHFTAIDADDSSLTVDYTASLTVADPTDFTRTGERLRVLAAARDFHFGYANLLEIEEQADFALYKNIAAAEFNMVSTENSMKWGYINPEPGIFRFDAADTLVQFSQDNDMLLHGHPLIWYTILPPWVQQSAVADREGIMLQFIDDVVSRYSENVAIWDVVNEAFEDDGSFRQSVWFEAMGESYIDKAFHRARANDADGVLLYNEYDIGISGDKSDAMYALVQRMVNDNVPIDGVGFQMHVDADFNAYDQVASNFQRIADLGLDVYVTELDVSIKSGQTTEQQADVFANVLSLCLQQTACKATQIWGFTDRYSWLKDFTPLILDKNYQQKPAYGALQSVLETPNP